MKEFHLLDLFGFHKWSPWRHVDLPVLYHLGTGEAISGPFEERNCLRCGKYQMDDPRNHS